ncbi:MAG: hypothetical protein F6K19_12800 [Cyanothece sp. SIO1E1]|nr:hypothetical protein [Cyanothece sp. SIO1E1]
MAYSLNISTAKVPASQARSGFGGFTYLKGNCPVCAGERKDCRQNGDIIHCRGTSPAPGFKFQGEDGIGFGMYIEDALADNAELRAQRQQEQIERKAREAEKLKGTLPLSERDEQYRRIANASGLTHAHWQKLTDRGLTSNQIDHLISLGYFSWQPGQRFQGISTRLPGVDQYGQLHSRLDGYAVPILNTDGQIQGYQLKPEHGEGYIWVSSLKLGGYGPQLPTGELPVGVCRPVGTPTAGLNLAEGFLKPQIAALRFGQIFIGANGGQFGSYPQATLAALRAAANEQSINLVILNPDAGSTSNPDVLRAYEKTFALLESAGFDIQVRWWGQATKEGGDVDEIDLDTFNSAQLLTIDQFKALYQKSERCKPDSSEYAAVAAAQAERDRIDQLESHRQELERIKRTFSRVAVKRRRRPAEKPKLKAKPKAFVATTTPTYSYAKPGAIALYDPAFAQRRWVIEVIPDTVPTYDQWQLMGSPRLICTRADRPDMMIAMVNAGYPTVLVAAITGEGKSHDAGAFAEYWNKKQESDKQAIIDAGEEAPKRMPKMHYVSSDYRNPTDAQLEAIAEAPSAGPLNYDHEHYTPSGATFRRRARGEKADIDGLCTEDGNIQAINKLGMHIFRGADSEFCQGCPHFEGCPYLSAMKAHAENHVERTHLRKLSVTAEDITIIDEAGKALGDAKKVEIKSGQIEIEIQKIARWEPDLYRTYRPVFDFISQRVSGAIAAISDKDMHGRYNHGLVHFELFNSHQVDDKKAGKGAKKTMPAFMPTKTELDQVVWDCISDHWLTCSDVWQQSLLYGSKELPSLQEVIRRATQPDPTEALSGIASVEKKAEIIKDWFTPSGISRIINLILGKPGTMGIDQSGKITIQYSTRPAHRLNNARTNFLLDATPDITDIAKKLRKPITDICVIYSYKPTFNNTTVSMIEGFGVARQQREFKDKTTGEISESPYSLAKRTYNLVEAIAKLNPNGQTGILDYKRYVEQYTKLEGKPVLGHQFVHNRGSNEFKSCNQIISPTHPTENLGELLAEWHLDTGKAYTVDTAPASFWSWVDRRQTSEQIQTISRPRAQYRPDEQIDAWLCSDTPKAMEDAIREYFPEINIQRINVLDICPEAAPKGLQTTHAIIQATYEAIANGEHPEIKKVAAAAGVTKGRVSQIVKSLLGLNWSQLETCLVSLCSAINRKTKLLLEDIDPIAIQIAQEFLPTLASQLRDRTSTPQEMVETFHSLLDGYGGARFQKLLAYAPLEDLEVLFQAFLELHQAPRSFATKLEEVASKVPIPV